MSAAAWRKGEAMAGLLGLFKAKKKPKDEKKKPHIGRPTKEMQAERRKARLQDATVELRLIEIEKKKRQLLDGDEAKGSITHEQVLRVVAYLKELGLEVRARGGGKPIDEDGLRGMLHDLADSKMGEALGRAIAAAVSGQVPTAPAEPARQIEPAAPQPAQSDDDEGTVDPSFLIIQQLNNKTPAEAATWFLSRKEPQARILIRSLVNCADDELGDLIEDYKADAPALARWLLARPDWTVATVHALRAQMRAKQAPAADVGL